MPELEKENDNIYKHNSDNFTFKFILLIVNIREKTSKISFVTLKI